MVKCYTCNSVKPWKEMQCGHFVTRTVTALRYHLKNTRVQCLTKHSLLRLFNGTYKSIEKIQVGDLLWGFDEKTFVKRPCVVENTTSFIPEELYKVTLENGRVFYATSDHMVVSHNQWITIKDMLHDVLAHDIMEL